MNSHEASGASGAKKINLIINGIEISVPAGTTILEAARKAGAHIPTLCDFAGLGKRAVCRICVVECDGRSKLVPACANEVWEGVNVVTNNHHVLSVRKTIVELLLANHPQNCLFCVRSGTCELQKLSADFAIRENPFHRRAGAPVPESSDGIIERDMGKCIKCGRCVEACQEVQTVRAINSSFRSAHYSICTPFNKELGESSCIYCGKCAEVCPVGALYEKDQTALVWEMLSKKGTTLITQIAPQAARAADGEFGLPAGTITGGKLATALKLLGFGKVFDAGHAAKISIREKAWELSERIKHKGPLPMIVSCSSAADKFVKEFYPDLLGHLSQSKSPEQAFAAAIKTGPDASHLSFVSIMPCIAKKLESRQANSSSQTVDVALTVRELARMIRIAGIDLANLPETPFDGFPEGKTAGDSDAALEAVLSPVYEAYFGEQEAGTGNRGQAVEVIEVNSLAAARTVFESILKGGYRAVLVLVRDCSIEKPCMPIV